MTTQIRFLLISALCFYLTGCTAYYTVELPGADESLDYYYTLPVEAGDKIRVILSDGTKLEGVVVSSDRESLTIDEKMESIYPSNDVTAVDEKSFTYGRRVLPLTEIASLRRHGPNTAGTVVLAVVGAGVVAAAIVGSSVDTDFGWEGIGD